MIDSPFVDIKDAIRFLKWFIEHEHFTDWDICRAEAALSLLNDEVKQKLRLFHDK